MKRLLCFSYLLTVISVNANAQDELNFNIPFTQSEFLDDIKIIDSIKNRFEISKCKLLIIQPQILPDYSNGLENPKLSYCFNYKDCNISSILLINDTKETKYWIITFDRVIYEGVLLQDSIFLYQNYLLTGVLKTEDLNENSPNVAPLFIDNQLIFFVMPVRSNSVIYYEDKKFRFYFEEGLETYSYNPLPAREKYRKEWSAIIQRELSRWLPLAQFCILCTENKE